MMSSLLSMNEDLILDIMSRCSSTDIQKFRLLDKALNKPSHEMNFIDLHLHRTNSVLGFFIQYLSSFISISPEESGISLEFLPESDVRIEACDTHHGILLCVDYNKYKDGTKIPDYIVCKPATEQYRIIPNPKPCHISTIACGLMVIQSNPFRYKILRVSEPKYRRRDEKKGFCNLNCEVFDSSSFTWKQLLYDLELPKYESIVRPKQPVSSWGYMHWLTSKKRLIRFCMRTETWSFLSIPREVVLDQGKNCLDLMSYEGKLGLICSNRSSEQGYYGIWVMEKSNGKSSWVHVKDVETQGLYAATPFWFPSNDVMLVDCYSRFAVYDMRRNKYKYIQVRTQDHNRLPFYLPGDQCFPFYSNHEMVLL